MPPRLQPWHWWVGLSPTGATPPSPRAQPPSSFSESDLLLRCFSWPFLIFPACNNKTLVKMAILIENINRLRSNQFIWNISHRIHLLWSHQIWFTWAANLTVMEHECVIAPDTTSIVDTLPWVVVAPNQCRIWVQNLGSWQLRATIFQRAGVRALRLTTVIITSHTSPSWADH